jgi:hypothetical protein
MAREFQRWTERLKGRVVARQIDIAGMAQRPIFPVDIALSNLLSEVTIETSGFVC